MKIILHRGNLKGPNSELKNSPSHLKKVLESGYDCEIDAWCVNGEWCLDHDNPECNVLAEKKIEIMRKWGYNDFS